MTPEILKISAINCFSSNEMIVDPGKFKSIIFIFFYRITIIALMKHCYTNLEKQL